MSGDRRIDTGKILLLCVLVLFVFVRRGVPPDLFDFISTSWLIVPDHSHAHTHATRLPVCQTAWGALRKTRHVQNEETDGKEKTKYICEQSSVTGSPHSHLSLPLWKWTFYLFTPHDLVHFYFSFQECFHSNFKKKTLCLEECLKRRNGRPPALQLRTQIIRQHRKNKHPSAATTRQNTLLELRSNLWTPEEPLPPQITLKLCNEAVISAIKAAWSDGGRKY